jgi:hypothetical protein
MGTILASAILSRAATIIQDETNTRWPEAELLKWLNDGQREIVLLKPDSYAQNEAMELVVGTKQSIPAAGLSLIDVVRNMGVDGETPGRAIRLIKRKILDEQVPDWHSEEADNEVKHFTFDDRDPKRFYVYPPSDGTTEVEVVYASSPADVIITDPVTLDDIYSNALLDYVLYRAYQKDADYAVNDARVANAYQSFRNSLGLMDQKEMMDDIRVRQNLMATPPSAPK